MMPLIDGVGCSEFTTTKQRVFREVFGALISHSNSPYTYVDLTAGPGIYTHNGTILGSPMIALNEMNLRRMKYDAYLYEESYHRSSELSHAIGLLKNGSGTVSVINDNYLNLPSDLIPEDRDGLVYADTNGTLPPFELYGKLNSKYSRLDLLTTYSATYHKRGVKAGYIHSDARLPTLLSKVGKDFWLVREPMTKQQWTFLLGTNNHRWKELDLDKFYDIHSSIGWDIYCTISLTRDEMYRRPKWMPRGRHVD